MGMCTSVDILQAKVDKLLGDIEGVKTYIVSVLREESFYNHIEKLEIIFGRLRAAGLKSMLLSAVLGYKRFLT